MAIPKLEFDRKEVIELNRYLTLARKNSVNMKPVMNFAVAIMAEETIENFRRQGRPPHRWPALSEATIRQREKEGTWPGQILIRFAQLWQSLQPEGSGQGSYSRVSARSAEYGTTLEKARPLQEGAKLRNAVLPPRPFLYWTPTAVRKIMAVAATFAYNPDKARAISGGSKIPSSLMRGF